ncbi:MAG: FAD-dependent oxidoreductase, partial [Treponema sp.]|nr:FAD-dependent oxidoreductase [Treponema sp.]
MPREPKRKSAAFDVVIAGGGMTGLCAALVCARRGIKTALVQDRPVFGGNASSEIRMHVCGASCNAAKPDMEESGLLLELQLENKYRNEYYNYSIWDAVLWNAVKRQKNLTAFLNTVMYDAETSGGEVKRLFCYQSTTETHWTISGRLFADCTGNGTLSYLAGAEFRTGSEGRDEFNEPHAPEKTNNDRMGNSLLFKAVNRGKPVEFKTPEWAWHFTEDQLKYRKHSSPQTVKTLSEGKNGGISYTSPLAENIATDGYCVDYGYWWIELPGTGDDIIGEYEKIRDDLVGCIYGVWDHIKNGGDHGAADYDLLWVGMLPGVREGRRIVGDYILTENDLIAGRIFDDAVAYGGWPIDNHAPNGLLDFDKLPSFVYCLEGAYTIPYRCFYAKGMSNLFVGGRILSASKLAMSSTRVMGTCAAGGQALGTAAAMCVERRLKPGELLGHIGDLQQALLKDDCYIPGHKNTDKADLARSASVQASSFLPGREPERVINGVTRSEGKEINYWESDGIKVRGETLTFDLAGEAEISQVRVTFDSNLSRPVKITLSSKRMAQQEKGSPSELVSDYRVTLYHKGAAVAEKEITDNYQRLNMVDFEKTHCDRVTITCLKTRGIKNA